METSTQRAAVIRELAAHVFAVTRPHPVRVAVDGCSAAGKSTLADELAEILRSRTPRAVIRVGIDHFKRAVKLRTRYPADSPESYYLDSWDYEAVRDALLLPLGPGGTRRYRTAVMDLAARERIDGPLHVAPDDAVLIADGAFLQRPELAGLWDLCIYVDVGFDDVLRRGIERDRTWMGSPELAEHRYRTKYIPGERRYVAQVQPAQRADIVVDNRDFATPGFVVRATGAGRSG
jgi:uridine kinase